MIGTHSGHSLASAKGTGFRALKKTGGIGAPSILGDFCSCTEFTADSASSAVGNASPEHEARHTQSVRKRSERIMIAPPDAMKRRILVTGEWPQPAIATM